MSFACLFVFVAMALGAEDAAAQCQQGGCQIDAAQDPDYESLMQSASVRVRLDSMTGDNKTREPARREEASSSGSVHQEKNSPSEASPGSATKNLSFDEATSGISFALVAVAERLKTATKSKVEGPMLMIVVVFVVFLSLLCMVLLFPQVVKNAQDEYGGVDARNNARRPMLSTLQGNAVPTRESSGASPFQFAGRLPQDSMVSGVPGRSAMGLGVSQSQRPSMSAFSDRVLPGSQYATMPPGPAMSWASADHQIMQMQPPSDRSRLPPAALSKQAPPALCPTLVMPVCEARFGVPMNDLAGLGSAGTINIVGLSGNPLLRAVKRQKSLEICMPEKNSAPRASISPSPSTDGYEIRGMKGSFYGYLQVQSTGTCYVIKDGETVLLLDGDTENLQLSVKSALGSQLASVRCSAEPFGGVEHVEIRVEAGVDTVLVLAVVLGVLLLCDH